MICGASRSRWRPQFRLGSANVGGGINWSTVALTAATAKAPGWRLLKFRPRLWLP
jgi:hypothetical protein